MERKRTICTLYLSTTVECRHDLPWLGVRSDHGYIFVLLPNPEYIFTFNLQPVAGIKEANKAVGAVGLIKAPGAALILVDNPLDNKAAGEALKVDMAAAPADMVAAAATVMAKVVALWEVAMNNRVMAEVP